MKRPCETPANGRWFRRRTMTRFWTRPRNNFEMSSHVPMRMTTSHRELDSRCGWFLSEPRASATGSEPHRELDSRCGWFSALLALVSFVSLNEMAIALESEDDDEDDE